MPKCRCQPGASSHFAVFFLILSAAQFADGLPLFGPAPFVRGVHQNSLKMQGVFILCFGTFKTPASLPSRDPTPFFLNQGCEGARHNPFFRSTSECNFFEFFLSVCVHFSMENLIIPPVSSYCTTMT